MSLPRMAVKPHSTTHRWICHWALADGVMVGAGRAAACIIAEHEVTVGAAQPRASSLSCPWILQSQLAALAPLLRPPGTFSRTPATAIGRASCRERVRKYVLIS